MGDIDRQARLCSALHDRRTVGWGFMRPAGGTRAQIYAARIGTAKWQPVEDIIHELVALTGATEAEIFRALLAMSLPRMKVVKTKQTLSERLERLVHRAQNKLG